MLERIVTRAKSLGPKALDLTVAGVVLLAVSVPFVFPIDPEAPPPGVLGYLLAAGTAIPLVWRRRAPLECALVVAAFTVGTVVYDRPGQLMQYGAVVAVYTVAALGPAWQGRGLLVGWIAGVVIVSVATGDWDAVGLGFGALTVVCAHALGRLAGIRQQHLALVERDARRRARLAELEAEQAAAAERQRIARDMHDIVAHAVSVMIVQAEAGAASTDGSPATAAHFDAISEAGREATGQLRRTLRALRDVDTPAEPSNGLADLAPLVKRIESTGLSVKLHYTGTAADMPADLGVAAHRVIQEALTNVVRHSGATVADIHLDWRPADLVITVTDNGRSTAHNADEAVGRGLIGIRERAAACGGSATTGPLPEGGFQVRVVLPLPGSGKMDP